MAKLVFGMNMSLDGYVDYDRFAPDPALFRYFIEQTRNTAGSLYGPRLYELMRYWDADQPGWDAPERAFAEVWRAMPKWVMSRSLKAVGPNATLISADFEIAIRKLKAERDGEIEVGGPKLAASLAKSPPAAASARATAAARGLMETDWEGERIARKAMEIAASICVYTNGNLTVETIRK